MIKSPYEKLDGLVYLPRMLQKIRLQASGELPEDYFPYLGTGFDGRCVDFLQVDYDALKAFVLEGASEAEILEWLRQHGATRTEDEKLIWNEFMIKRGWRDSPPQVDAFQNYKEKYGYGDRKDILTYFEFFEVDEGRAE